MMAIKNYLTENIAQLESNDDVSYVANIIFLLCHYIKVEVTALTMTRHDPGMINAINFKFY